MKTKTKNLLLDRLEKQAVEIAELTVKVAEEKARATKLRNWWDEETEKADRLDNQCQEQATRIQELEDKLEVADLAPELEPFAKAETRDEVS